MALNFIDSPAVGDTVSVGTPPRTWRCVATSPAQWERVLNAGQVVSVFYIFTPVETDLYALPSLVSNAFQTFTYL